MQIPKDTAEPTLIKVGLPGESIWAEVVGLNDEGRVVALLRNESVHLGIQWGDPIVLGEDGYTVERPELLVRAAQTGCDAVRSDEAARRVDVLREILNKAGGLP